jgi:hypothetical protein
MEALLTVELLSTRIHKSVTSIRSDATRNPQSLPPICRLPGTKRLLWREVDVEDWVARHVGTSVCIALAHTAELTAKAKLGRPTKRQQMLTQQLKRNINESNFSKAE